MNKKFILLALLSVSFWLVPKIMVETEEKERMEKESIFSRLVQELKSDAGFRIHTEEEIEKLKPDITAEELEKLVIRIRETEEFEKIGFRVRAVEELGGRKDKSAVFALIGVLEDKEENWSVKIKAAEALVNIGASEAFYALLDAIKYESEVERKELFPPPRHSFHPDEYVEGRLSEILKDFIEKSPEKKLHISSLEKHINDKKNPIDFRYRLGTILGGLGQKSAVPILIESLKESKRGDLRAFSAALLGELGAKEAIPYLKEALRDDYLGRGFGVSKDIGEEKIKYSHKTDGMEIFAAIRVERRENHYIVRSYAVRNNAAASLHDLGVKVVKEGSGFKVIEEN